MCLRIDQKFHSAKIILDHFHPIVRRFQKSPEKCRKRRKNKRWNYCVSGINLDNLTQNDRLFCLWVICVEPSIGVWSSISAFMWCMMVEQYRSKMWLQWTMSAVQWGRTIMFVLSVELISTLGVNRNRFCPWWGTYATREHLCRGCIMIK